MKTFRQWVLKSLRLLLVIGFLPLACHSTQAAMLYSYDLDSLVSMAPVIVEGTPVRSYVENNVGLVEFKISKVHRGDFKEGQSVAVTALDFYRKRGESINPMPLENGDALILFLAKARSGFAQEISKDSAIHVPAPSGVKLVQDGAVLSFSQWDNPGPYVADSAKGLKKEEITPLDDFRKSIAGSIQKTEEITRRLGDKSTAEDVPWLLELIRERAGVRKDLWQRDHFTELACSRLANMHDPAVLDNVISKELGHYAWSTLARGFGTPAGREYLLKKIADDQVPSEKRLRYTQVLRDAGERYHTTFTDISTNSWRPVEGAEKGNGEYLVRVARLARDKRAEEPLCLGLISVLERAAQSVSSASESPAKEDFDAALPILKEIYAMAVPETIKFAIEQAAAQRGAAAYEGLQSPCGPLISIIKAADPKKYTVPAERSFIFEYSYHSMSEEPLRMSVKLTHEKSGKVHLLSLPGSPMRGKSMGGGSNSVVLPKDLPPGKYRAQLQSTQDGKVVSTGHYCEVEF